MARLFGATIGDGIRASEFESVSAIIAEPAIDLFITEGEEDLKGMQEDRILRPVIFVEDAN